MTAPRSVKVGRVELQWCDERNEYANETWDLTVRRINFWRAYGFSEYSADADSPSDAADALTAKLKQLRAALADVLGEEEGTK